MDTKMILANGVNLRCLDMPNKGKETIVFIPCGGGTIGMWNGLIPYFKNDFRIVSLDMRCHGFSDRPEECHLNDMANDIAAVMDELEIENAYIIGSSLGAEVALSLAANYPEKVIAMILDGAFYDIVGPDSKDQIITEEAIAEAKSKLKERILSREIKEYDSKEEYIQADKEAWEKHYPWSEIVHIAAEDEIMETEDGKFRTNVDPNVTWRFIDPLYDVVFQDYFDKITCPILWLPDEAETPLEIVQKNLKKYAKNLMYHKIITLKNSVHAYTCMLNPEDFYKESMIFIDEVKGL
ncbi:MAG: alpha/beta fold hydrolase [Candidatus Heimdallarchaeota archaeon]